MARLVVLGPAGSFVCLERIHVGHFSSMGSKCLNFGTPSTNLCAVYRQSSDVWPKHWCQSNHSVCEQIAFTLVVFLIIASIGSSV